MPAETDASLYQDIFERAPDPILVHDPETGAVARSNQAACQLVGLARENVVGSTVGPFSFGAFDDGAMAAIEEAATEESSRTEWAVCGPDGDRRQRRGLRGGTADSG